jgi:hypothetical protein
VRFPGIDQRGEMVLHYCPCVIVRKMDTAHPEAENVVPELPAAVDASELIVPAAIRTDEYDCALSGSTDLVDDYQVSERIDHVDGMSIEEGEHMMAIRLYQNTDQGCTDFSSPALRCRMSGYSPTPATRWSSTRLHLISLVPASLRCAK